MRTLHLANTMLPSAPPSAQCWDLCNLLYPPNCRQTLLRRRLHIQASRGRCANIHSSSRAKGKHDNSRVKNDLGLIDGTYSLYKAVCPGSPGKLDLTIQGTFIRPTGSGMPSMFSNPKRRLRLEIHWAKKKLESFFM